MADDIYDHEYDYESEYLRVRPSSPAGTTRPEEEAVAQNDNDHSLPGTTRPPRRAVTQGLESSRWNPYRVTQPQFGSGNTSTRGPSLDDLRCDALRENYLMIPRRQGLSRTPYRGQSPIYQSRLPSITSHHEASTIAGSSTSSSPRPELVGSVPQLRPSWLFDSAAQPRSSLRSAEEPHLRPVPKPWPKLFGPEPHLRPVPKPRPMPKPWPKLFGPEPHLRPVPDPYPSLSDAEPQPRPSLFGSVPQPRPSWLYGSESQPRPSLSGQVQENTGLRSTVPPTSMVNSGPISFLAAQRLSTVRPVANDQRPGLSSSQFALPEVRRSSLFSPGLRPTSSTIPAPPPPCQTASTVAREEAMAALGSDESQRENGIDVKSEEAVRPGLAHNLETPRQASHHDERAVQQGQTMQNPFAYAQFAANLAVENYRRGQQDAPDRQPRLQAVPNQAQENPDRESPEPVVKTEQSP